MNPDDKKNRNTKMKTTAYKNFIIEGSHRNRQSYVVHPTELDEHGSNKLLFLIEREQDEFMGRPTGFSYVVISRLPKRSGFLAESWGEVIAKLNEILA